MSSVEARAEPVPLDRVDEALAGLWERCRSEPECALTRSLTVNLITVARAAEADRLRDDVRQLRRRHNCRAFVVLVTDDDRQPTVEVSGESQAWGRGQEIVFELVELTGGLAQFANLAALIRPLLVNDIPSHLYWATQLPPDDQPFLAVAKLVDHVTVDSALLQDASERSRLRTLAASGRRSTDLAWSRLRPWRRAMAESLERFSWQPEVPTSVVLTHGDRPAALTASALLAEWLEDRLGAAAELRVDRNGTSRRSPERLELSHGSSHVVVRRGVDDRLRVEVSLADRCLLPFFVPAGLEPAGELLAEAVDLA